MSVLDAIAPKGDWSTVRFDRAVVRSQEDGRPDLPPLSVFLDAGVVLRDSRSDNHNVLGADLAKYLVVHPGDIVFNKLRTWQGGLGVSRFEGLVSPAYFVCRPRLGVEPRFLHYLLRSTPYLQELTRISKWMPPAQFDIGWDSLRLLPTLLPSLSLQRSIADYLDRETSRIDALIEKKRRMIELTRERWEAGTAKAVTEGVRSDAIVRSVETLWTKRVNSGWDVLPLRRRWSVIDCKHITPEYVPTGFPLVSHGEIADGKVRVDLARHFVEEVGYAKLIEGRQPGPGDIIYTRNASIGNAGYVGDATPFAMGQDVCLIRSKDQDQRFLTYFLNTLAKKQLDANRLGATFGRINVSQILDLQVPCPPTPEEQGEVADVLDEQKERTDRVLKGLTSQITLLTEHRQALITAAVTGELAIPGAAA